jgi:hypothetical protein
MFYEKYNMDYATYGEMVEDFCNIYARSSYELAELTKMFEEGKLGRG